MNSIFNKFGRFCDLFRQKTGLYVKSLGYRSGHNQPRVLISYISAPLFINDNEKKVSHSNELEFFDILHWFLTRGYVVDVTHCNNSRFIEDNRRITYDLVFGFGLVFDFFKKTASSSIIYVTENAPNAAYVNEYSRVVDYNKSRGLLQRKAKVVRARVYYQNNHFDGITAAIILQNEFNLRNFEDLVPRKQILTLSPSGLLSEGYKPERNLASSCSTFVWLGSRGLVHKGLDLLVEVFSERPELTLHILGMKRNERSLLPIKLTDNIIDHGFIPVGSEDFRIIMNKCSFVILPSCSEAMSTGVLTGMRHGLIPVVSREVGVSIDDYGELYIETLDTNGIRAIVKKILALTHADLRDLHKCVFDSANQLFSLEKYSETLHTHLNELIG